MAISYNDADRLRAALLDDEGDEYKDDEDVDLEDDKDEDPAEEEEETDM